MIEHTITKIISFIPSKAMRDYLSAHKPQWTMMQAATVVCENADKKNKVLILTELSTMTDDRYEQELLRAAVKDIKRHGCVSKATERVYHAYRSHPKAPNYPFMEVCNLPVLFHSGDVIRYMNGFAFVEDEPVLTADCDIPCDISDECYLGFDLNCKDPMSGEERFDSHVHISLFDADYANPTELSALQYNNLQSFRERRQCAPAPGQC